MALVLKGNSLTSAMIQPGWGVSTDGFGLETSTTTYKVDHSVDVDVVFAKGTAHPDAAYTHLKVDKWRINWDSLLIATVSVDYVGINPTFNGGEFTNANTSGANGLTSENITTHPNFFVAKDGYLGAIAGTSYQQSPLGPLVEIKSPADYGSQVVTGKTLIITKQQSFIGLNGSCFESENGGRFIGFVDPSTPQFYGKTNYLAATTTFSGVIYVLNNAYVIDILSYLNKSTITTDWGTWSLLPDWANVGMATAVGGKNLLSQVNVEAYGSLYKVSYEIRFADRGWDVDVYKASA